MTRPEDLIYAVDERPPWPRLVLLGLQHAMLMSVYLVLIVIVFRHAVFSAIHIGPAVLAANTGGLPAVFSWDWCRSLRSPRSPVLRWSRPGAILPRLHLQAQFHRLRARRGAKKSDLRARRLDPDERLPPDHVDRRAKGPTDHAPRHALAKSRICHAHHAAGSITSALSLFSRSKLLSFLKHQSELPRRRNQRGGQYHGLLEESVRM